MTIEFFDQGYKRSPQSVDPTDAKEFHKLVTEAGEGVLDPSTEAGAKYAEIFDRYKTEAGVTAIVMITYPESFFEFQSDVQSGNSFDELCVCVGGRWKMDWDSALFTAESRIGHMIFNYNLFLWIKNQIAVTLDQKIAEEKETRKRLERKSKSTNPTKRAAAYMEIDFVDGNIKSLNDSIKNGVYMNLAGWPERLMAHLAECGPKEGKFAVAELWKLLVEVTAALQITVPVLIQKDTLDEPDGTGALISVYAGMLMAAQEICYAIFAIDKLTGGAFLPILETLDKAVQEVQMGVSEPRKVLAKVLNPNFPITLLEIPKIVPNNFLQDGFAKIWDKLKVNLMEVNGRMNSLGGEYGMDEESKK